MQYREILEEDVPALFEVRVVTHENRITREELTALGITEESVRDGLRGPLKGWLCEIDGQVVGFAMGDRSTGEMGVIAVLPDHVDKGIGGVLLKRVEAWLLECGCPRIWLTTDVDTRRKAYGFYLHCGWKDDRIEDGNRYMVKELS